MQKGISLFHRFYFFLENNHDTLVRRILTITIIKKYTRTFFTFSLFTFLNNRFLIQFVYLFLNVFVNVICKLTWPW